MKVEMAVLAEAANVTEDGRMNIMGIFDEVEVESFPADLGDLVLAMRLSLGYSDGGGKHVLTMESSDEDGQRLWSIEVDVDADSIEAGKKVTINQIIHLRRVTLEEPGEIILRILWDQKCEWESNVLICAQEAESSPA